MSADYTEHVYQEYHYKGYEPIHQREEVVRCRDCKYGYEVIWPKSWDVPPDYRDCGGKLTTKWDYYNDEPQSNPVPPDGFCAWGERRND